MTTVYRDGHRSPTGAAAQQGPADRAPTARPSLIIGHDGLVTEVHRTWRAPLFYRVLFGLVGLLCTLGAILPWDGIASYWHDLGIRLFILLAGAIFPVLVFSARMGLTSDELQMRGAFTSRNIPLCDIIDVTPGRSGLEVRTADGAVYLSPSFIGEKAPVLTWLGRRGRADGVAETILRSRPG